MAGYFMSPVGVYKALAGLIGFVFRLRFFCGLQDAFKRDTFCKHMGRAVIFIVLAASWQMVPASPRIARRGNAPSRCQCGCGPVCRCCCQGKSQTPNSPPVEQHLCRCPLKSVPLVQTFGMRVGDSRVPVAFSTPEFRSNFEPDSCLSTVWARSHGPPDDNCAVDTTVLVI